MAKKELKLHAIVAPTQMVIASAYDKDGKVDACTLAFYMVSSHVPPCVTSDHRHQRHGATEDPAKHFRQQGLCGWLPKL